MLLGNLQSCNSLRTTQDVANLKFNHRYGIMHMNIHICIHNIKHTLLKLIFTTNELSTKYIYIF